MSLFSTLVHFKKFEKVMTQLRLAPVSRPDKNVQNETYTKSRVTNEVYPNVSFVFTDNNHIVVECEGELSNGRKRPNRKYNLNSDWYSRFLFSIFNPKISKEKKMAMYTLKYSMEDDFSKFVAMKTLGVSAKTIDTFSELYSRVPQSYKVKSYKEIGYWVVNTEYKNKNGVIIRLQSPVDYNTSFITYINYLILIYGVKVIHPKIYACVDVLRHIRSFI